MLEDRTKFHIVAGEALVDALTAETKARCRWTGYGYASDQLCVVQREYSARGILGAEVTQSLSGWAVRYDSGLQDFGAARQHYGQRRYVRRHACRRRALGM